MEFKKTEKYYALDWRGHADDIVSSTPIDEAETAAEQLARIHRLEALPEEWFQYYFPKYASAPPAPFHMVATRRVLGNAEWYEVRNWSRELAKSTRTMMEVLHLTLVGNSASPAEALAKEGLAAPRSSHSALNSSPDKKNVLIISNSYDNAERLLMPYQLNLELNKRIINDYGLQRNFGQWTRGEFVTKPGVSFRAVGAGQSPRGTRNEAARPDIIIFDDLDTDEDCRNPTTIDNHWNWVQEAVIPTRSVSEPLLVIWCGNIIAEDCCIVRAREFADVVEQINIRDEHGKSTWPEKNSEEDIDRVLSLISYASQQKEYYNNPMTTGKTFTDIRWDRCPPLHEMRFAVCYADPSPSNKDNPGQRGKGTGSRKAVFVVARKEEKCYIYTGMLDVMGTRMFIASLYACRDYIGNACLSYFYIENNSLQDPFYEQVLVPEVYAQGRDKGGALNIQSDTRKKPDKWSRIEATLEPLSRMGNLIFNIEEQGNPHMRRLEAQFKAAKPASKDLDGPDAIEGAVYIINQKTKTNTTNPVQFQDRGRSESKSF